MKYLKYIFNWHSCLLFGVRA